MALVIIKKKNEIVPGAIASPGSFSSNSCEITVADDTKALADRIRSKLAEIGRHSIEIGQDLLALKEKLPHGDFGKWIAAEFNMSPRTAQYLMSAARFVADKSETLSHLPLQVLYSLAAPSTPAEVREKVVAQIENGSVPTEKAILHEIQEAKRKRSADMSDKAGLDGELETRRDRQQAAAQEAMQLIAELPREMLARFVALCEQAGDEFLVTLRMEAAHA